jgi:hypothetical protein
VLPLANGVSASEAATSKYTKPSAPTNLSATGGLENAYLNWKAPINNPNKPSAKPAPLWFSFTVAATNSIGTGLDSSVGHSKVQVRFRATLVFSNKFAPPTPKVTPTPALVTPVPITFVVSNGAGSGTTNDWTVTGQVIDAKGVATITASNSMYGSFTFSANFAVDGATKLMGGAGTGSQTLVIPTLGELRVEYSFNVRRQS